MKFSSGLKKTAAWGKTRALLNKAKGFFTGKETFYHNTSSRNARRIAKEGFKPSGQGGRGAYGVHSDRHSGRTPSTYFARNPDFAKTYGQLPHVTRKMKPLVDDMKSGKRPFSIKEMEDAGREARSKAPSGRQIKVEIHKKALKNMGAEEMAGGGFTSHIGIPGNIPPKYIRKIK